VLVDDICIDEGYNMAYLRIQEGGRIRKVDVRYYKEGTDGEVSYTDGEVIPREEILRRVRLKVRGGLCRNAEMSPPFSPGALPQCTV
jgi:hypothetical protein